MEGLTPFLDEAELHKMKTAKQIGGLPVSGSRCFIGDMTDIFGEWVPDDLLNRLFSQVLEIRTDVTWQILTKRAERMRAYLSWRWGEGRIPSRHIHVGVSVENQHFADERITLLLQTPAALRFISAEPLLGPIDLDSPVLQADSDGYLDWVIVGGESGPRSRPFNLEWARSIAEQCKSAGVPCFVKQLGSKPESIAEHITWRGSRTLKPDGFYRCLNDRKGGDPSEWPADLRLSEFPEARR